MCMHTKKCVCVLIPLFFSPWYLPLKIILIDNFHLGDNSLMFTELEANNDYLNKIPLLSLQSANLSNVD